MPGGGQVKSLIWLETIGKVWGNNQNRHRDVAGMRQALIAPMRRSLLASLAILWAGMALAEPQHGIAMYGEPALPPDFVSLPYANANAPKGGRVVFGASGAFDSLNPFIQKGNPAVGFAALTVETLMGRSYDEPFTLYGLLAESVETDEARSWVEFTLRPEAKFADGSPVTPEDVIWSFETLGTQGHGRYAAAWAKVAKSEITGPNKVKFTFNTEDRELPLIMGLRPVLKKAQWEGRDFTASGLDAPIGSGPYIVGDYKAGVFVSYQRNPNWWGKDLPFYRGLHNFDEIRYEYFGDATVIFEAFKAGELTTYTEASPVDWQIKYDFPALTAGEVVKSEIPHGRPSGIEGFAMNTRKPLFSDWRVREALITAFNFELVNKTINDGKLPRIVSYFSNSMLGADLAQPATAAELALLEPFKADLPPGTLEGYVLPVSDGTEANRKALRAAMGLLEEAGWSVAEDGKLKNAKGEVFTFEILLQQGQENMIDAANIYIEALKPLGIAARLTVVDSAQYVERTGAYDFDMTHYIRALSLSPGNEQTLYWGSKGVTEPGTRNWMGVNSAAADAMIATMLAARSPEDFTTAVHALDRVLTAGRYVIPMWYLDRSRIAHAEYLHYPEKLPLYGDFLGFNPEVWWSEE
jgi:peptide/nickel transport system substrate-binding protein